MRVTLKTYVLAACACLVALCTVLAVSGPCWADEESSASNTNANANTNESDEVVRSGELLDLGEENYVNPHQLPDSSFIYDTTIEEVLAETTSADGQTVQIIGEVIGDCIKAELEEGYYWLVLEDEKGNSVSCYVTEDVTQLVDTFGRYGQTGTKLQVRGTVNFACADHQGLTDVHVEHASLVAKGKSNPEKFNLQAFFPGLAAVAAGLFLLLAFMFLRERSR